MSYVPAIDQLALVMNLSGGMSLHSAIYMTSAGSVVLLLSFIGCCGFGAGKKMKRRHRIVVVYGLLTLLFMLFDIALIIYLAVEPYGIQDNVEINMRTSLHKNFMPVTIGDDGSISLHDATGSDKNESANARITMQFEQACCGVTHISDYNKTNVEWDNDFSSVPDLGSVSAAKVPPSCCMQIVQNKVAVNTTEFVDLEKCMNQAPWYTNQQGCINYVMQQITRYNFVLVSVAAGLTALQAIILAMVMGALSEPLQKIGVV
jgi:hypothetical protein